MFPAVCLRLRPDQRLPAGDMKSSLAGFDVYPAGGGMALRGLCTERSGRLVAFPERDPGSKRITSDHPPDNRGPVSSWQQCNRVPPYSDTGCLKHLLRLAVLADIRNEGMSRYLAQFVHDTCLGAHAAWPLRCPRCSSFWHQIDTQHSWTYPGFGCGVLLRPQFPESVLYSQAQQIAFYKSQHAPQVTRPLVMAAEIEAAQTIRDNFIQPTVNAFGYTLDRFTIRWASAP